MTLDGIVQTHHLEPHVSVMVGVLRGFAQKAYANLDQPERHVVIMDGVHREVARKAYVNKSFHQKDYSINSKCSR
jgi:hypothetical protein